MPTFRKLKGSNRNDSSVDLNVGIPLINSIEEYNKLNKFLQEKDNLLIIKIHPKQDLSTLKIKSTSNIIVLTGEDIKSLEIDNYRLMSCIDALISDYSSAASEFLHVNKPIAYVLNDMNDYKLGFCVDNIYDLIAGHEIYNITDFKKFIEDVSNNLDPYKEKRKKVRDFIFSCCDGNSCKRLADLLQL